MKKKVLVFPCGSEIGLELNQALKYSAHFEVIGGSSVDDHGMFAYKKSVTGLPFVDDLQFIERINELVKEYKIDFIFPAHDSVVLKLAEAKAAGELDCDVVTSPLETCKVTRSKSRTYAKLVHSVKVPQEFKNTKEIVETDLPVFIKPDVGQGSKGTFLARTKEEVDYYLHKQPELLCLEYLPGKEYTVDCFTNKQGELLFCMGRERIRISNGISVNTNEVDDKRFAKLANKINEALVFRGAWFFQIKENKDNNLVLLEVAPRIAGTSGYARIKGVNLPLLSLFDAMNIAVEVMIPNSYSLEMDRALQNRFKHDIDYKHVYLDFDDLLIIDGKVNQEAMMFVYQCINKGVKTHLLTRHKEDLHKTLSNFRLTDVFDELLWVKNGEDKADYIKETPAIFIDDSFVERNKVYEKKGIPVFDAHMIEGLLE